jgi:WD40 repeat protein
MAAWATRGDRPGSRAHEIAVYDLEKAAPAGAIRGHGRAAHHVALDPRGTLLATAAGDGDESSEVLVWEVQTGRLLQALPGHPPGLCGMAFSHDGGRLVTACRDGAVKVWDAGTGKIVWERSAGFALHALALSGDGTRVAVGGQSVVAWTLDGTERARCDTPEAVRLLALSHDGSLAAWSAEPGHVRLTELDTGGERESLPTGMKDLASLALSPDGRTLAVGGSNTSVRLWDVPTGQQRVSLPGHRGGACHVEFAGDGGMLFSAGAAREGRLWYARRP